MAITSKSTDEEILSHVSATYRTLESFWEEAIRVYQTLLGVPGVPAARLMQEISWARSRWRDAEVIHGGRDGGQGAVAVMIARVRIALQLHEDFSQLVGLTMFDYTRLSNEGRSFEFASDRDAVERGRIAAENASRLAEEKSERERLAAIAEAETLAEGVKLVRKLHAARGVMLMADGDRIKVLAGALTDADRDLIRTNRAGILAALATFETI